MKENSYGMPQWGAYLGKILILTGMVLVFFSTGAIIANYLCQWIYGVDIKTVDFNNIQPEDTRVISALKLIQTLAGSIGMFLIPALLFPRVINYDANTMLMYKWSPKPYQAGAGILLFFISIPFLSWLIQINQQFTLPEAWNGLETRLRELENQAENFSKVIVAANTIPVLLVNIFVVAVVPAICEEVFFRGIILQYTRYIFDYEWVAIIVSAIIFSAFHAQFYGFLPRFFMGILLGYLFLKTANLWVPVIFHFLNNTVAVLVVYFGKDLSGFAVFDEKYEFPWYMIILSLILTTVLLWWVQHMLIKSLYTPMPKKKKIQNPEP